MCMESPFHHYAALRCDSHIPITVWSVHSHLSHGFHMTTNTISGFELTIARFMEPLLNAKP